MSARRLGYLAVAMAVILSAASSQAQITISSDEVWDGVSNPRAGEGVTLNNGVYSIPTALNIAAGGTIRLFDVLNGTTPSSSITFEFTGSGGLTFADSTSTIDVYVGGRNQSQRTFTMNMNNNAITASTAGAGRIINGVFVDGMGMTGDSMSVTINSNSNVSLGMIDVTKNDAQASSINIVSQGLVDIDKLANGDVSTGGGSTLGINVTAESMLLGAIDTRAARTPDAGVGAITLRALGQPENSAGDFNANFFANNTITLDGAITGNSPGNQAGGNITATGVKVTLTNNFTLDKNESGVFTINAGTDGNGFTQSQLFVNNSGVTPNAVNFSVFHDGAGPGDVNWAGNNSGNWNNENNWNPVAVPSANNQRAIFGSAITEPQTIYMNQANLVKTLRFDTTSKVAVAGTSSLTLDANTGSAGVEVAQGAHEVQVQVNLADNTTIDASPGTEIDFNGIVNLGGFTLTVTGGGQVDLNNQVTGAGSIASSGVLGTGGATGVTGSLASTGTLDIDISGAGANRFDAFNVTGPATLSGILSVDLTDGFTPTAGQQFTVLTASNVSAASLALGGPDAAAFTLIKNPTSLVLQAVSTVTVPGDYNGNGIVDAADYTVYRDNVGSTTNLAADGSGNGVIDAADYTFWRTRFGNTAAAGAAASAAVPEPATWMILGLAAVGAGLGRRRLG